LVLLRHEKPAAKASVIYNLLSDHCDGGCGPAGTIFGTITLAQDLITTTLDVTVHLNSGFRFAKTGSVDFEAFLFDGAGVVLADITVDAHTPTLAAVGPPAGPFTASGIGTYTFGIGCPGCGVGLSDTFSNDIVFHVANATISDLIPASGSAFAADIGNLSTGRTGPIDASLATPTPEPVSSALVGTRLIGLFFLGRRRAAR
jgi:hypothetical protein